MILQKKSPWFSSRQVTDHEYVVLGFIGRVKLQRVESCKSVSQSMDDSWWKMVIFYAAVCKIEWKPLLKRFVQSICIGYDVHSCKIVRIAHVVYLCMSPYVVQYNRFGILIIWVWPPPSNSDHQDYWSWCRYRGPHNCNIRITPRDS